MRVFKNSDKYLKATNLLHTTQNSSLKYVFIVFFETNQIQKYIFLAEKYW